MFATYECLWPNISLPPHNMAIKTTKIEKICESLCFCKFYPSCNIHKGKRITYITYSLAKHVPSTRLFASIPLHFSIFSSFFLNIKNTIMLRITANLRLHKTNFFIRNVCYFSAY